MTVDNNSMLGQVLQQTHTAFQGSPFLTPAAREFVKQSTQQVHNRRQALSSSAGQENPDNHFDVLCSDIAALLHGENGDEKVADVSRVLALESVVTNAVDYALKARKTPSAKEQISTFLKEYLAKPGQTPEQLAGALDKIIISLVHTMHPTIYHTMEARRFEGELIKLLEKPEMVVANMNPARLSETGQETLRGFLAEHPFVKDLKEGKAHITPIKKVTPGMETLTEKENLEQITQRLNDVVVAWNEAVKELPDAVDKAAISITPERQKKIFELRTWGRSADADGREQATSSLLYESIQQSVEGGEYKGPMLDLRQHRELHEDALSSLIQVKYRNSEYERYGEAGNGESFHSFCTRFMEERKGKYDTNQKRYADLVKSKDESPDSKAERERLKPYMGWHGVEHSIFQQLTPEDQYAFVSEMIKRDDRLVPAQVAIDTLEFQSKVYPLKQAFLQKYGKEIRAAGLDPSTISYKEMIDVNIPDPGGSGQIISLRGQWDTEVRKAGFALENGALSYTRLIPYTAEQIQAQNLLQSTHKVAAGDDNKEENPKKTIELKPEQRATAADVIKRLQVINAAKDKYANVADRYQIASFRGPEDFMIALKLFQDTGIVNTEKGTGLVTEKPKLGIMPLLETQEDLENGEKIFKKLLDDPIAMSFWKQRGGADLMVGFSDGAASAGNLASQWQIYQATKKLTKLFADRDIKLRVFQGRGRGPDRGGTIDPSLQFDLMPPEVTRQGIYDVTIQSDLPMDLAASPSYAKDYFTKILLGNLKAVLTSKQVDTSMETHIQTIADIASKIYNEKVRNNPTAFTFLDRLPDNDKRASRAAKRGETWDKVRAISKEYKESGSGDLPMKNVGLLSGLNAVAGSVGENVKTIRDMAKNHPFFGAIMKIIRGGMDNYDPTIARAAAKVTDCENIIEDIAPELDGLADRMDLLLGHTRQKLLPKDVAADPAYYRGLLDQTGHGVLIGGLQSGRSVKPEEGTWWDQALKYGLFTTAQEVSHRSDHYVREPHIALTA